MKDARDEPTSIGKLLDTKQVELIEAGDESDESNDESIEVRRLEGEDMDLIDEIETVFHDAH